MRRGLALLLALLAACPAPATAAEAPVPFVGVAAFRSSRVTIGWRDLRAALAGGPDWSGLVLIERDAEGIGTLLGIPLDAPTVRIAPDAAALAADLRAEPARLGFLRASEVTPATRPLAWGARRLFGSGRVRSLADWPLRAELVPDPTPFRPETLWSVWAGGDLGVDRGVAAEIARSGVDFPWAGGVARLGRSRCCSSFGWELPTIVRTGRVGAVRELIAGADLAFANLEGPTPPGWRLHRSGTRFTGDPAQLAGLAGAGIDAVGLANNHIGDAGPAGVNATIAALGRAGIAAFGAGADPAAARRPLLREFAGTRVALLAYDAIAPSYAARPGRAGSAPLRAALIRADIAAARRAGARVVIVFPHWGVEYTRGPSAAQRRAARAMIDAGADLVIGNHPHWIGALETYRGRPIWYALGNFTFDQSWSEPTMEGISLEITFAGARLVAATVHAHVAWRGVQPNLLDPASAARVLAPVWAASPGLAW